MTQTMQNLFQAYILKPHLETKIAILNHLDSNSLLSPSTGLDIYINGYRYRLVTVLENDYPKLKAIMEERTFYDLLYAYIEYTPSKYYSVRHFGAALSDFLATHKSYKKNPYLAELAKFEWQLGNALDSKDAAHITIETLKNIPHQNWSDMKLHFHPSCQMLKLHWNVPQVWQALEKGQSCPPKFVKQKKLEAWMFYRSNLQSCFRSVSEMEAYFFCLAQKQYSFGEICEKLSVHMSEDTVPSFALVCLQTWIQESLISEIS